MVTPSEQCESRIRLTGSVAGVDACEVVCDGDEVRIGSAIHNDLVVCDPLVPPRAFKLVRKERHYHGNPESCDAVWMLETYPGARVFLNDRCTRRDKVTFGDRIAVGCHQILFAPAGPVPRNRHANVNVADLCAGLMQSYGLPPGFLNTCPSYFHRQRLHKAFASIGVLVAALAILVLVTPRDEYFEQVQPPLEIEVTDGTVPAEAVRSLDDVARQKFDTQEPTLDRADLVESSPRIDALTPPPLIRDQAVAPAPPTTLSSPLLDSGTLTPMPLVADTPDRIEIQRDAVKLAAGTPAAKRMIAETEKSAEPPALATHFEKTGELRAPELSATEGAPLQAPPELRIASAQPALRLSAMAPSRVAASGADVSRDAAKLGSVAPARRLSVEEAARRATEKSDLAAYRVKMDPGLTPGMTARTVNQDLTASLGKPAATNLTVDRAAYMERLARYKASPVQFEEFRGTQIPVAQISEQLAQLEVQGQKNGTALTVDGTVSAGEMDVCWKSGGFKLHTQGTTPPDANPPTYCYVGKSEVEGKPFLYISFVCVDPEVAKIKTGGERGVAASLIKDDSVEVYLDTNNDRKDYYQLAINAKGSYWAGYWSKPMSEGGRGSEWNCTPTIKSTINQSGGQWSCEIMIPFDKLGGVPAKGTRWAVNFCRNFRGQEEDWQLQSWFAVYDKHRNFHHPNLFGLFQW